jgi:hypothetical protein
MTFLPSDIQAYLAGKIFKGIFTGINLNFSTNDVHDFKIADGN